MQDNSHAAIIPPDTFPRVQDELERRKDGHPTGRTIFSGRIYCGECGKIYGSKVWHSNDPYRKVVWQCNDKFKKYSPAGEKRKCSTPTLTEERIRAAFEEVLRMLGSEKEEIVLNLRGVLRGINCKELEEEKEELEKRRDGIADLFSNERATLDQELTLSQEYDRLSEEITRMEKSITERKRKKRRISEFIKALEESGEGFSETDWCVMVEKVTVFKEKMVFLLTSGVEVEVEVEVDV